MIKNVFKIKVMLENVEFRIIFYLVVMMVWGSEWNEERGF